MNELHTDSIVVLSVAVMFAFFFLSALLTGRSFIRFPWKTDRENNPGWFWMGQIIYLLGAGLFLFWMMSDLYRQGYFSGMLK